MAVLAEVKKPLWKREGKRVRYEKLRAHLDIERSSFIDHWRQISTNLLPHRPLFQTTDTNRGDRKNLSILDSTATYASDILTSGMMASVTNPARPWFRLTAPGPDLSELGPVKDWLHIVTEEILTRLLKTNLYDSLPMLYQDGAGFGTGAMLIEEDDEKIIHTEVFAIGSYFLANDDKGRVRLFFRDFRMTVRQLIEKFGRDFPDDEIHWDRFSTYVQTLWANGSWDTWIDVCHVIQKNENYNPDALEAKYSKRYVSCYYERGVQNGRWQEGYFSPDEGDVVLRESGYDYFPVLVFRWSTRTGDVYGVNCPGMMALGDIRMLQTMESRGLKALEKMINPPLQAPPELKNEKISLIPGDTTYVSSYQGSLGVRPIHEVRFGLKDLKEWEAEVRERIYNAFSVNIILSLTTTNRRDITATEVEERREEKLLALGRVLQRLDQDLLNPLIDIVFDIMLRRGLIPPPPPELEGAELKVEYISILAQAQKLIGIAGLERFAAFVAQLAAVKPDALDKVDWDQMVDEYGERTGVPPRTIIPDDVVAQIRAQRAQQMQAEKAILAAKEATASVKNLATSPTDSEGGSALTELLRMARAGELAPAA